MKQLDLFCLRAAGLNGLMGVSFGAFGAHALKGLALGLPAAEGARMLDLVATGSRIQLLHAAALLALAALAPRLKPSLGAGAARGFAFGGLLFAASLYALALGAPPWVGAATPFGGVALLTGWALVAAGTLTSSS